MNVHSLAPSTNVNGLSVTDGMLPPFDRPPNRLPQENQSIFNDDNQPSNGGLLLRQKGRTLGVCWRPANTMTDRHDPNPI
jgi:hypothetical protein